MLLKSTVREVPGKSPGNFWGSGGGGKFWELQGLSRSSGKVSLPPSNTTNVGTNLYMQFLTAELIYERFAATAS